MRRLNALGICGVLLLSCFVVTTTGCGYTHKTTFPQDVQSVQVKMFGNRTFYRGFEFALTEAIIKEIELRTPYKVVSNDAADTRLQGSIVGINQVSLSRRRDSSLPEEMEIQMMVDFSWRNQRTGKVMTDRKGLLVVGRYVPPLKETLSAGEREAVQKMASQIVASMAGNW